MKTPRSTGKRRRVGSCDEDENATPDAPRAGSTGRKPRRALHAVRREEIRELLAQLEGLEAAMRALQRRAVGFVDQGDAASDRQAAFASRVLRVNVQRQQIAAAPTLRRLSEYSLFNIRAGSPVHQFMRLPKDPAGRRSALLELRDSVLDRAEGFLRSRFAWVNPRAMVRDHLGYEAPDGDYCLSYVSSVQFDGRATVGGVFNAVQLFLHNIEIVLSERLGSVTIREDDQHADGGVSQNRLVSFTPVRNLVIESNYAVFSRFDEEAEVDASEESRRHERRRKGYGIAVLDFIDEDELYPYQSGKRARRDGNAIVEVTAHTRPRRRSNCESTESISSDQQGEDESEEEIVTVIHWVNMRLHRPAFTLPDGGWQELRHISERWVSALQFALQEIYVP